MEARAVTTIGVRFAGLVMAAAAVVPVVTIVHDLVQSFCMGYGISRLSLFVEYDSQQEPLAQGGWLLLLAAGAYLLLDGRWVIGRIMRGLDGTCAHCGYDLKGVKGACPECGKPGSA